MQGARGKDELDPLEFDDFVQDKLKLLDIDPAFLERSVNDGFSGGEKKRNEILQMAILEPMLAILDETDSGPGHRCAAHRGERRKPAAHARTMRCCWLRTISGCSTTSCPDYVHVMDEGRIVKTGGKELALELESRGYDWVAEERAGVSGRVMETII